MPDRLYGVVVSQTFSMAHVVRASSKRAARDLIIDLTFNRIEPDDPRIVDTFPTGYVGDEKVSNIVTRIPE